MFEDQQRMWAKNKKKKQKKGTCMRRGNEGEIFWKTRNLWKKVNGFGKVKNDLIFLQFWRLACDYCLHSPLINFLAAPFDLHITNFSIQSVVVVCYFNFLFHYFFLNKKTKKRIFIFQEVFYSRRS